MRHKVAGISFQEENIILLARENEDYSLSKKELLEQYADGDEEGKSVRWMLLTSTGPPASCESARPWRKRRPGSG